MRATAIKTLALVALGTGGLMLSLPSCSKAPSWSQNEWTNGSGELKQPPNLSKTAQQATVGDRSIEFRTQSVENIPVAGSFIKIVKQGGKAEWAKTQFLTEQHLPSPESVKRELKNKEMALKVFDEAEKIHACTMMGDVTTELQWEKSWQLVFKKVCETPSGKALEIVVNSRGQIISSQSVGAFFAMTEESATIYPLGPKLSQLKNLKVSVSSTPSYLKNNRVEVVSDAGSKIKELSDLQQATPGDDRFSMIQAYYYADRAFKWVEQNIKYKATPIKIRTNVGHPNKSNVAFYYNHEVRLGQGDDITFSNMPLDPTIVVHESMHSVVQDLTQLPFQNQGGSISEGLADSITAIQLNTPYIGQASYQAGPFQRSLLNSAVYSEANDGLYHDSLILSGTIWEIKESVGVETSIGLVNFLLAHLAPSSQLADVGKLMSAWLPTIENKENSAQAEKVLRSRGWL